MYIVADYDTILELFMHHSVSLSQPTLPELASLASRRNDFALIHAPAANPFSSPEIDVNAALASDVPEDELISDEDERLILARLRELGYLA